MLFEQRRARGLLRGLVRRLAGEPAAGIPFPGGADPPVAAGKRASGQMLDPTKQNAQCPLALSSFRLSHSPASRPRVTVRSVISTQEPELCGKVNERPLGQAE